MTVYHIVLFKLKPNTPANRVSELRALGDAMVGEIPGLSKFDLGPPLESTAHRSKGYDLAIVAILDKPGDVKVFAEHPAHLKLHELRLSMCDDTLAYDLVF